MCFSKSTFWSASLGRSAAEPDHDGSFNDHKTSTSETIYSEGLPSVAKTDVKHKSMLHPYRDSSKPMLSTVTLSPGSGYFASTIISFQTLLNGTFSKIQNTFAKRVCFRRGFEALKLVFRFHFLKIKNDIISRRRSPPFFNPYYAASQKKNFIVSANFSASKIRAVTLFQLVLYQI